MALKPLIGCKFNARASTRIIDCGGSGIRRRLAGRPGPSSMLPGVGGVGIKLRQRAMGANIRAHLSQRRDIAAMLALTSCPPSESGHDPASTRVDTRRQQQWLVLKVMGLVWLAADAGCMAWRSQDTGDEAPRYRRPRWRAHADANQAAQRKDSQHQHQPSPQRSGRVTAARRGWHRVRRRQQARAPERGAQTG